MTMKRELEALAGEVDLDSPRMKRRRELPALLETTIPAIQPSATTNISDSDLAFRDTEGSVIDTAVLKDRATKLWQTVKDAVNKEGNICSPAFMRLPSKRHYPDYYNIITHPICLDDIKKKIDENKYPSLDDVRQDFELCFTNAKRYNMKDSLIWLDAKFLLEYPQKLANKEYTKLTGKKVKRSSDYDENGDEKPEGEGDDDKKKNKPPNMNRLLKSRLQKLVEKTDEETHRVLSDVFMEMPSKKDYPSYYKQIKRPMCLEYIFKRLKRKEYTTSEEFANEVELVFSNALEFNQDHSQIWEDAITLRDYFRQLMSDLPPPHALARYAKTPGRIKLKVPGAPSSTMTAPQLSADSSGTKPIQDPVASPLTFKLPGSGIVIKSPAQALESLPKANSSPPVAGTPAVQCLAPKPTPTPTPVSAFAPTESSRVPTPVPTPTLATMSSTKVHTPASQVAAQQQPQYLSTPQYTHYPNATYHPATTHPVATPKVAASATAAPVNQVRNAHSVSRSPAPSLSGHRPLKEVFITVKPRERSFWLDHRDGVKSWAMKLDHSETILSIVEVKFLGEEERDTSDEDADNHDLEEEEEEPLPKKRGRGRPRKNSKSKARLAIAKKSDAAGKKTSKAPTPSRESIQVVLNGKPVGEKPEQEGVWDMELQSGTNILEVGEKGGYVWKVYLDRMTTA